MLLGGRETLRRINYSICNTCEIKQRLVSTEMSFLYESSIPSVFLMFRLWKHLVYCSDTYVRLNAMWHCEERRERWGSCIFIIMAFFKAMWHFGERPYQCDIRYDSWTRALITQAPDDEGSTSTHQHKIAFLLTLACLWSYNRGPVLN